MPMIETGGLTNQFDYDPAQILKHLARHAQKG